MTHTITQLALQELDAIFAKKKLLVIGGTAGIGKELAIAAMKHGANVTIVGRRSPGPELNGAEFVQRDLSSMKNARSLADDVDVSKLDTIIFTNGIFASPERQQTDEGIELDLAVSYLSRFVFVRQLFSKAFGSKRIDQETKPRIFVMGYPGKENSATLDDFNSDKYSAWPAHMNTVVGNEALVSHINSEYGGAVNVYGLNPGLIKTEIREGYLGKDSWKSWFVETLIGWFAPSAETYVNKQLVHIIASPELENRSGVMIDNKRNIIAGNPWLSAADNFNRIITESTTLADRALSSSSL